MHTFRFNPIFNQWVLLGTSYSATLEVESRHLLDVGRSGRFLAATHPRQPFILEPPSKSGLPDKDQLYADQPPVGEYELLLYKGKDPLVTWDAKEWAGWITLVQQRLRQLQHNPYLHHVHLSLNTGLTESLSGYQRVGDLIAASHPLCGMSTLLDDELARKIRSKDNLLTVHHDASGRLMVPPAPLHEKELWYLPENQMPSLSDIRKGDRENLARLLSVLVRELKTHYADEEFVIAVHTALIAGEQRTTWWLQVHKQDPTVESPIPVRALPEVFLHKLRQIL